MGQEIAMALASSKNLEAYLGVDSSGDAEGFLMTAKNFKSPFAKAVDVWIDFSSPEGLEDLLAHTKAPVVSGVTGLGDATKKKMAKAAKTLPLFWASNMSLGVAVLQEALKTFSHLEGFDFQIEEAHHRRKKDKPSGTAITLQTALEDAVGHKCPEPLSIRGGGIFGIHTVWAMSDEETLTFTHQALNRAVFARGAVRAAAWIAGKKPGLYSMKDIFAEKQSRR